MVHSGTNSWDCKKGDAASAMEVVADPIHDAVAADSGTFCY